jgi:hypothetical protein
VVAAQVLMGRWLDGPYVQSAIMLLLVVDMTVVFGKQCNG